MGKLFLVTGGARSGKSRFAEALAARLGEHAVYIATAEATDAEMADRIARHRGRRPVAWTTIEAHRDLVGSLPDPEAVDVILIDCLAIWASNRLLELDEMAPDWSERVDTLERQLGEEIDLLAKRAREAAWHMVAVTNEVGFGIVPPTRLGRTFRDLLGRLNQRLADHADEVYLVVAGLSVEIKHLAARPTDWER